jgi:hypothetical protein
LSKKTSKGLSPELVVSRSLRNQIVACGISQKYQDGLQNFPEFVDSKKCLALKYLITKKAFTQRCGIRSPPTGLHGISTVCATKVTRANTDGRIRKKVFFGLKKPRLVNR